MTREPKDTMALALIAIVGLFVFGSMTVVIVLAFAGVGAGENIWAGLFSLTTAILGAVGGYLAGSSVKKNGNGNGTS